MKRTLLFLATLMGLAFNASAARIYVNLNATGNNSGTSWSNAYTSLANALNQAQSGDEIWVAQGTYLPGTTGRHSTFALKTFMHLYGGFNGTETLLEQRDPQAYPTILEGDLMGNDSGVLTYTNSTRSDNVYSVVTIDNVDGAEIDGFIIQGGNANSSVKGPERYGAGVYITGSNVADGTINATVRNCTIRYCTAVYSCAVQAKHYPSTSGDAMNVRYENLIVHDNQAEGNVFGGGGNTSDNSITYVVANCLIYNNTSSTGYVAVIDAQLSGSIEAYWVNNTIVNNNLGSTPAIGLGRYNSSATSEGYFYNNVFHNNGGGHEFDQHPGLAWGVSVFAFHNNMVENPDYTEATSHSGNIVDVPDFVNEATDDFRLTACSPGVEDGDTLFTGSGQAHLSFNYTGQTDALGSIRYFGSQVDMGAYERSFDTSIEVVASAGLLYANLSGSNITYQWFDCATGIPLPGETDDSLHVTANGSYYVEITEDSCLTARSACGEINTVSLIEKRASVVMDLFPNPVSDRLHISSQENIDQVTIVDISGCVVLKTGLNENYVDVSLLRPGVYILLAQEGDQVIAKGRFNRLP
ncbi:MAG TPA: hypothetical protein DDW81_12165 [Cryomorphaceae bacterium]|nr:hypothetical protein [Owenweeksia sp.]HBF20846.1 hypothetical protein [Cryomorphaceae bacterium]